MHKPSQRSGLREGKVECSAFVGFLPAAPDTMPPPILQMGREASPKVPTFLARADEILPGGGIAPTLSAAVLAPPCPKLTAMKEPSYWIDEQALSETKPRDIPIEVSRAEQ